MALTEFEQLILLALLRLEDEAYGVLIQREIASRTRRDVPLGSVYAALTRLEERGLISSHLGQPTAERGGRRKKYFEIHADGRKAVQRSLRALQTMMHGLDVLLKLS